ncbi:MAG: hypothetical protein AB1295_05645 [Candidatus Micrarchaeota archaeon]
MRLSVLLLLISLSFAQYAEPPLDSVMDGNRGLSASLASLYNSSYAFNSTMDIVLGSHISSVPVSSSIQILALSPQIDDTACAVDGMAALFARGEEMGVLTALPSEGYPDFPCDSVWFDGPKEYAWRCDFDGDSCAEFVNSSGVFYEDLMATFSFRGISAAVPFSSTVIEIPQEVRDELDSASGNDSLLVEVSGNLTFFYEINDRQGFGDCGSNYVFFNHSTPISINRSFSVGGSRKLFFLESPVLREQWYRDNRFDVIVLSQCPLYRAEIYENGNLSDAITIRWFSIETDGYGMMRMRSEAENATEGGWSERSSGVANPFQLERENISYLFAYRFEHGYAGLGDKNISITVRDAALSEDSFNETITSRMLSYHGAYAEDGSPADSVPARPSLAPKQSSLISIEVAFGLISLVILIAFVNSWLLGGS